MTTTPAAAESEQDGKVKTVVSSPEANTELSESEVAEIQVRWKGRDINLASWDDVDSLIRTVRSAWADNKDLRQSVEEWVTRYKDLEAWRAQTAVRLSEVEKVRDQLSAALSVRDAQLKEVERERDDAREVATAITIEKQKVESLLATVRAEVWRAAISASRSAFDQQPGDSQAWHDDTMVNAGAMERRVITALESARGKVEG